MPLFPPAASTFALHTDALFWWLLGLSVVFATVPAVLAYYWAIKYRRGARVDRSNPLTASSRLEAVWILGLTGLSLITFLWAAVPYIRYRSPPADALEITAVGLQWMWKFQHPTGRSEINELHVPLGRPVRLLLTSQDVIHAVKIPAFRLTIDAIPGTYTTLWFQATRPGTYHLFCAEYCGTGHSQMVGSVTVMEAVHYQAWLAAGQAEQPLERAGFELFRQLGCSGCHVQGAGELAPPLEGLFGRPVKLADGRTVIADEAYIRDSILLPQRDLVAGFEPIMPTYQGVVSEEELLQLVAYIRSLSREEGP